MKKELGVWFPTIRTGTGTDIFTERLVEGLNKNGIRAEITWLPLRTEYLPWSVKVPTPPQWATVVHVSTWLHHRFIPKNLPYIATLHHAIHDPVLRPHKSLAKTLYHQYWKAPNERYILKSSAQVTAVSQFVADMAKKTLCDVPIQVIYNGVDTSLFHPINKSINATKPFRLLYIGGWKTLKGVDLLAPIMRKLGNEYELYYTGGDAAEKDKIHMPSNMYDLGRLTQQDVVKEMQMADAFLFPSKSEGFGLVVAEAMACGLPCFLSNISVLNELIDHEKNGISCDIKDIDSFVKAIKNFSQNPKALENISTNGLRKVNQYFSNDVMIKAYIDTYKHIYEG